MDQVQQSTQSRLKYEAWLSRATPIGGSLPPNAATTISQRYDYVCGSAILLTSDCLAKLESLPHKNFLYFEELHLARKLEQFGMKSDVCTDAWVSHEQGVTTSSLGDALRCYYVTFSSLKYTWEHCPFFLPTVIAARVARAAQLALNVREHSIFLGCLKGLLDFCMGREERYSRSLDVDKAP